MSEAQIRNRFASFRFLRAFAFVFAVLAAPAFAFDPMYYEEEAGLGFSLEGGSDAYGISVQDGTWLRETPVFGEFFMTLFENRIEDSAYAGVGMIFRLMPHWEFAPFIGAGGSYNRALGASSDEEEDDPSDDPEETNEPESYWAGIAEAGVRIWLFERTNYVELFGRETWPSISDDSDASHNYWVAGAGYGQNF